MKEKPIYFTEYDFDRLTELLESTSKGQRREQNHLDTLQNEIERAIVVRPNDIPPDVVTMNSTFSLMDMSSGKEETYTLVYPEGSNFEKGRISILATIGMATIGYRVGDIIEWNFPSGKKIIKITKILYQPESSGNYDI